MCARHLVGIVIKLVIDRFKLLDRMCLHTINLASVCNGADRAVKKENQRNLPEHSDAASHSTHARSEKLPLCVMDPTVRCNIEAARGMHIEQSSLLAKSTLDLKESRSTLESITILATPGLHSAVGVYNCLCQWTVAAWNPAGSESRLASGGFMVIWL
jgi:hypothetical protein